MEFMNLLLSTVGRVITKIFCMSNFFHWCRPRSGQSSSRQHASRPEATPLDFVVRPQSKIDPEEIRARAKQAAQDQQRMKVGVLFLKF